MEHGGLPGTKSLGDAAWFESDAPTRISIGGNRAGKTTKLILEIASFCIGYRPWYSPDSEWFTRGLRTPGIITQGFARARYTLPSFQIHLPEVIKEFEKWVPSEWWKVTARDSAGVARQIRFWNRSEINFMSHHMDASDFEGVEADVNAWDEPPPKPLWSALERGLVSTGGRSITGCTLLDSAGWFWDEIIPQGQDPYNDKVFVTWHSMWDNTAENGGCAAQTAENVRNYLENKISDPDERLAREHGFPMHIGGIVLNAFDKYENVVEPHKLPEDCLIACAIDPAGSRPMAALFIAYWMRNGHWVAEVFDEIWMPAYKNDLSAFAVAWHEKTSGHGIPHHPSAPVITVIDPFSQEPQKADQLGRSLRRILDEDHGIRTVLANRSGKRARLLNLNAAVKTRRYKIWSSLKRLPLEIRRWTWDPASGGKLTKGPDDMCDCWSYAHTAQVYDMLEIDGVSDPGGVWIPEAYRDRERRHKAFKEKWNQKKLRAMGYRV